MSTRERWAAIQGYEGAYSVSTEGVVRSEARTVIQSNGVRRAVPACTLKPKADRYGYLVVTLCGGPTPRSARVHRLVAAAFLGECPAGQVVRHLDGNPANNAASNLAYGTHSQNLLDQVRHGTHRSSVKTRCKNGHEYTAESTGYYDRGGSQVRVCKVCNRACVARYKAARTARAES